MRFQLDYILAEVDPGNVLDALRSVPSYLSKAYNEVLKRIGRRTRGGKALALRILSRVIHSRRPLYMAELCEAITQIRRSRSLSNVSSEGYLHHRDM